MSQNAGDVITAASIRRLRPLMGTLCAIEVTEPDGALDEVVNHAYAAMQRVNDLMHPVNGVDLSRINQLMLQVIQVDELTWQVLQLAKQMNDCSDGVFDPCLPSHAGCMRDVELLSDNQVICHAPVMMDLGGIAKGFAVDCAVKVLIESGCNGGLVNAGGDVRVFGKPQSMFIQYSTNLTTSKSVHPEPPIILSLSKDEGLIQTSARVSQVELLNQALAVSQYNHVDCPVEHQGYYRRSSDKFPLHEHVVVIAQSAAVADALTKCVMWCDGDASNALCKEFKAQVLFADKESW